MRTHRKPEAYSSGSPVYHFLALITVAESESEPNTLDRIHNLYGLAQRKAAPFGGERFHNRSFGGGVRFQSEEDAERFFESQQ